MIAGFPSTTFEFNYISSNLIFVADKLYILMENQYFTRRNKLITNIRYVYPGWINAKKDQSTPQVVKMSPCLNFEGKVVPDS